MQDMKKEQKFLIMEKLMLSTSKGFREVKLNNIYKYV